MNGASPDPAVFDRYRGGASSRHSSVSCTRQRQPGGLVWLRSDACRWLDRRARLGKTEALGFATPRSRGRARLREGHREVASVHLVAERAGLRARIPVRLGLRSEPLDDCRTGTASRAHAAGYKPPPDAPEVPGLTIALQPWLASRSGSAAGTYASWAALAQASPCPTRRWSLSLQNTLPQ